MKKKLPVLLIQPKDVETSTPSALNGNHSSRAGFSLVEVLVVMALLSLIVLVLMTVFNSTQSAFRAGVTQTDVLEGSRAAMDLMVSDLKLMTPSGGYSNDIVNLSSFDNDSYSANIGYTPLVQSLPGGIAPNAQRTNLLNYFFFLTKKSTTWAGIGYVVNATSSSPLYPLYRYYAETNLNSARGLFNDFTNKVYTSQWTNLSHLIDGVVDLRLHAYDPKGNQMMANIILSSSGQWFTNYNIIFYPYVPPIREAGFYFFSNSVPAAVELQMGVLEDRPLQRAESLVNPSIVGLSPAQTNYLGQQAGRVHIFRQRVTIPNVDPTAYQ